MKQEEAKNLIEKTLQNSFNNDKFLLLAKNIFNHVEDEPTSPYSGNLVHEPFKDLVQTWQRIGQYNDPDGKIIDILVVRLKREKSLDRARAKQRNFVAKYLNGARGGKYRDAALVAFVPPSEKNWRLSLVKMEYKFDEENLKVKEKFTPARRYSFLVGKNENSHTAQSRLLPALQNEDVNPTLQELEDTFDIERVTKEFFDKYRELFLRLKDSLDEIVENDSTIKADFTDKEIDTADFSKKLLGQIVFLYFLQKKGWFGVPRDKDWGEGDTHFLRSLFQQSQQQDQNYFNELLEPLFYNALATERDDDWSDRFECRIPFLNGGLFEPLSQYDWVNTDILLPDDLFSNDRRTKEGDVGDGILDVFDRYNFTVKEDEPLEKEVAVDPEMLGKVFENLLEVKDRKSKGTYYTPREIVHYMCQESLANYLNTELGDAIEKDDIDTLIKYGETVVEHDARVAQKGKETERYSFKMLEVVQKHAKRIDEKLASIRTCDPAVGSGAFPVGLMNEIVRIRNALTPYIGEDGDRTSYNFKREAIQNCLYGVDVDSGAIEICKLRLWLSLVVDEEERKNIQPLPNLDYKIVQGNSLLSVEKNLLNHQPYNELEKLKPQYFSETSVTKKQRYRKHIDELISQITNGHKDFDFEVYFSEVFHEKEGFDVVIGNPPYDVINDSNYKKKYKESIYGRMNLYGLFIHQSVINIARPSGHLTFINPKTLLADKYFINLRRFLKRNGNFKAILKIADRHKVFENVLQAVIVHIFQRKEVPNQNNKVLMHEIRNKGDIEHIENRLAIEENRVLLTERMDHCILVSDKEEVYSIFDNICANTTPFYQAGVKFTTGKIQWDLFKDRLAGKPAQESVRLIWAENIQRYRFSDSEKRKGREYVRGPITINPNIMDKTIITQRTTADEQEHRIIATIFDPDHEGFEAFSENNTNYLLNSEEFKAEFLLGLLNSKLFDLIFRHINSNTHVSSGELNSLPIKRFSFSDQYPVIELVNKILSATRDSDYSENSEKQNKVREYEKEVDQLVYKLYGLTEEEINMIENRE